MSQRFPGAGLGADFRVGQPAPGRDAPVPGKPRHLDESLHAHGTYIRLFGPLSEATLCRQATVAIAQLDLKSASKS